MAVDEVQAVFREVFDRPDLEIFPEMSAKDVEHWDSFNHINLIIGLEEAFDLSFSTEEIASMACVNDLIMILRRRGREVCW